MCNETKQIAFGIPSIKVITPIGKHSNECELLNMKMFWVAFKLRHRCPSRKKIYSLYTHYTFISMFFYILKKYKT